MTAITFTTPQVVGKVVSIGTTPNTFIVAVVNSDLLGIEADMAVINTTTGATTGIGAVLEAEQEPFSYTTVQSYYDALLADMTTLRTDITSLGVPASGLHYFRDTLYAVAPAATVRIYGYDDAVTTTPSTADWSLGVVAGDVLYNSLNTATALVLTSTHVDATPYEYHELCILPLSSSYSPIWKANGRTVSFLSGTLPVGLPVGGVIRSASQSVLGQQPLYASDNTSHGILWKAMTEQQLIDEADVPYKIGWQPVTVGYSVEFTGGTTEFVKLERTFAATPAATTYYLTNGSTVLSCKIVSFFVSSGDFTTSDAAGTMQIKDIVLVSGTLDVAVGATWDIHTSSTPAPANKIADLSSTMVPNSLPLIADLVESNTRYQMVTANFYADEDWDAFYGVNGVGRAFYYNGDFFAKIFTQATAAKDNPRHIAVHHLHLALGFRSGSCQLSVVGEPDNYSGLDGASEHGLGDRVTGMIPLHGGSLGVFCEKSIHAVTGTTVDNFSTQMLSPNTGCIEYSLVDMGMPVYCDSFGITTLEQSEKYGDFIGKHLSFNVNPWLKKRLRRITGRNATQASLIAAMPVRAKNQYRLFFKDGKILTMTMQDQEPKFTFQSFTVDGSVLTPFALSSQTDDTGQEHMHFSFFNPRNGEYSNYVYQWDEGWGMAGEPIESNFEINWFFGNTPSEYMFIQKAKLHGLTHGIASLKIQSSGAHPQLTSNYNTAIESIDLPNTNEMFVPTEVARTSTVANLASRGLGIQLKLSNTTLTSPEPSHTCQVLVLGVRTGGAFNV